MFVQIKCSFCDQMFDHDSSSEGLLAECPHCGKSNTVAAPAGAAKELTIQHGAPNLSGAQPCPSCKAQVARDAVLCVNCGYNLKTGPTSGNANWFATNKALVYLLGGGLVVVALGLAYLLWPEPEAPPPVMPPAESAAKAKPSPPSKVEATAEEAAIPPAAAATNTPPKLTKEELAEQKAEAKRAELEAQAEAERVALEAQAQAERAAFETKKFEAEQNLRLQLDTQAPLFQTNESVELRRKNGIIDKGTLTSFSGTGTGRVALVATSTSEIGVPLILLDTPSRLRLDPEFREAYIRHRMSTPPPAPAGEAPRK